MSNVEYEIEYTNSALKQTKRLDPRVYERIFRTIEALRHDPHPASSKKLSGYEDVWRIRVGSYRVAYEIYENKLLILVLAVGNRDLFYEKLRQILY